MKTTKEINQMLKDRYVTLEGIRDNIEDSMFDGSVKKNTKEWKKLDRDDREYFSRSCELIRIYADINDISFKDAMDILNNYKKSRRVAQ